MEGHKYFVNGIPKALWKEFRQACIFSNTTAKDHLIGCMQAFVVRYHRRRSEMDKVISYEKRKEKKK